jgi:hypothetical protein
MSLAEKPDVLIASAIRSAALYKADFEFIPKALSEKCRQLIVAFHGMPHYPCLPDMLWHGETRDFIELNKILKTIFTKASKSRSAKKANNAYTLIATVLLSLELLARDFAGWGRRFPSAKRKADALIGEFRPNSQSWLLDQYLYPRVRSNSALISALSPPGDTQPQHTADSSDFMLSPYSTHAADAPMVLPHTKLA